jgi:hypothetical protein
MISNSHPYCVLLIQNLTLNQHRIENVQQLRTHPLRGNLFENFIEKFFVIYNGKEEHILTGIKFLPWQKLSHFSLA